MSDYSMDGFQSDIQKFMAEAFPDGEPIIRTAKKCLEEAAELYCAVKENKDVSANTVARVRFLGEATDTIICAAAVIHGSGANIGDFLRSRMAALIIRAKSQAQRDKERGL